MKDYSSWFVCVCVCVCVCVSPVKIIFHICLRRQAIQNLDYPNLGYPKSRLSEISIIRNLDYPNRDGS